MNSYYSNSMSQFKPLGFFKKLWNQNFIIQSVNNEGERWTSTSSSQFTNRIKMDEVHWTPCDLAATAQRNPLIKLHEDMSGQMNRGDLVSLQMKLEWERIKQKISSEASNLREYQWRTVFKPQNKSPARVTIRQGVFVIHLFFLK